MKIVMRDGRVFQGTAVQIVQAMQSIAFGVETFTLDQYIDWVIDNARRFEGVELRAGGRPLRRGRRAWWRRWWPWGSRAGKAGETARYRAGLPERRTVSSVGGREFCLLLARR
jgi:hypothetical protein